MSTTPDAFAMTAATWLATAIADALDERGVCHLALSGGTTPFATFEALADMAVDWARVHLWQVDERVAPDGDPARNAVGIDASLVSRIALPPLNLHLMDVTRVDLELAAAAYALDLDDCCGSVLDIVHLGIGADGHTASWPPGDPVVDVVERNVAISRPYQGHVRMTLTVPCVNRARQRLFLVSGADKADALASLLAEDGTIPANRVTMQRTTVLSNC